MLAGSVALYLNLGFGRLVLAVCFLAPDLSALGYGLTVPTVFADTHLQRI